MASLSGVTENMVNRQVLSTQIIPNSKSGISQPTKPVGSSNITSGDYQRDVATYKVTQGKIEAAKIAQRELSSENKELRAKIETAKIEEGSVRAENKELRATLANRDIRIKEMKEQMTLALQRLNLLENK